MDKAHLIFLKLLESELGNTILPAAGNDLSRRAAALGEQQLARLLIDETVVPQLRAAALASYRELLPEIQRSSDPDSHRDLVAAIAVALNDWPSLERAISKGRPRC